MIRCGHGYYKVLNHARKMQETKIMIKYTMRTSSNLSTPKKQDKSSTTKDSIDVLKRNPIRNVKDAFDAFGNMMEEAEKKIEKKYRPNMFAEFKQLNATNGKVRKGIDTLLTVNVAPIVPELSIQSLADASITNLSTKLIQDKKQITLVLTSFKNYGLQMIPDWRMPFLQEFQQFTNIVGNSTNNTRYKPIVSTLALNIIEDWYMKLAKPLIIRGLKQATPEHLHTQTYVHFGRCDDFRTRLELDNTFVGYAHLVDAQGRVRWIAGGSPTPEELASLMKLTHQLIRSIGN